MADSPPTRVPNWDLRLADLRTEVWGQEFQWGKTDCQSLVRRAVAVIRGEEPWALPEAVLGGKPWYSSLREAQEAYAAFGADFDSVLREEYGAREVGVNFSQNGDLIFTDRSAEREDVPWKGCGFLVGGNEVTSAQETGVDVIPWTRDPSYTVLRLPA